MIRSFEPDDYLEVKRIHEKFYKEDFTLPNFYDKFLCSFSVIHDGKLVTAGGVRIIPETVIVTDKDISVRNRVKALQEMLQATTFVTERYGYSNLMAEVINDDSWKQHLMSVGFKPTKGNVLVLGL